jgi:hypothetical protein
VRENLRGAAKYRNIPAGPAHNCSDYGADGEGVDMSTSSAQSPLDRCRSYLLLWEPCAPLDQPPRGQALLAELAAVPNLNFLNGSGWDVHNQGILKQYAQIEELDVALSALVADLESRRMLARTLIIIGTPLEAESSLEVPGPLHLRRRGAAPARPLASDRPPATILEAEANHPSFRRSRR